MLLNNEHMKSTCYGLNIFDLLVILFVLIVVEGEHRGNYSA